MSKLFDCGPSTRGWHRWSRMVASLRAFKLDSQKDWSSLIKRDPLAQGELLHVGMAHYLAQIAIHNRGEVWVGTDQYHSDSEFLSPVDAIREFAEKYEIQKHVPLVTAFMEEYMSKPLAPALEGVVALEYELKTTLPKLPADRALYTQRADMIGKDGQGNYYIVDHKKVHSVTARTFEQFSMDGQFLGYAALGRKLWKSDFKGVYLHRCHLESKTHDLRLVGAAPEAMTAHFENLSSWERLLMYLEGQELDPLEYPGSTSEHICHGKYGPCDHLQKCRYG